jgi:hypothetical protein
MEGGSRVRRGYSRQQACEREKSGKAAHAPLMGEQERREKSRLMLRLMLPSWGSKREERSRASCSPHGGAREKREVAPHAPLMGEHELPSWGSMSELPRLLSFGKGCELFFDHDSLIPCQRLLDRCHGRAEFVQDGLHTGHEHVFEPICFKTPRVGSRLSSSQSLTPLEM